MDIEALMAREARMTKPIDAAAVQSAELVLAVVRRLVAGEDVPDADRIWALEEADFVVGVLEDATEYPPDGG